MSNPVISRIGREAGKYTPAGYPTMPGYTPAGAGTRQGAPGTGSAPDYGRPQPQGGQAPGGWDSATQQQWEQRLNMPAPARPRVDPVTMDDLVARTGITFGLLVVAAVAGWVGIIMFPQWAAGLVGGGFMLGFVLALVNVFKKTISPALICAYSIVEGVALGAVSGLFETMFPGIVVQAVLATLCVFAGTLVLFKAGIVRNSPRLMRMVWVGLIGLVSYSVVSLLLSVAGVVTSPWGLGGVTVFGIPLGLVVGVVAVLLGAASLVIDFDTAARCVRAGMPKIVAWEVAFGLMVTVVWLYLELLRLLAILRSE